MRPLPFLGWSIGKSMLAIDKEEGFTHGSICDTINIVSAPFPILIRTYGRSRNRHTTA